VKDEPRTRFLGGCLPHGRTLVAVPVSILLAWLSAAILGFCNILFSTPPHSQPLSPKEAKGQKNSRKYSAFESPSPVWGRGSGGDEAPEPEGFGQGPSGDYQSELSAARAETIQTDSLTISGLDLGEPHPGKNVFKAAVKNKSTNEVTLGLDLRAVPGLWFLNIQSQFLFPIAAQQERQIQGEYEFVHMPEEALLRVRFFFPRVAAGGVTEFGKPFFERKYLLGRKNPAVDFAKLFEKRETSHLVIYCPKGRDAEANLDAIAAQREQAFQKISAMLGVSYPEPIHVVFYADAETKTKDTGSTGAGESRGNNVIEVYGQLDPYHELTHVLAGRLGDPPAMFNEGLAVYVAERMGADALKTLGSPGKKVDEAVQAHRSQGQFIPIDKLFTYTDIGPEGTEPSISYPEAASFVKFLISKYGLEKFRQGYASLQNTDDAAGVQKNEEAFRAIYGAFPGDLQAEWLDGLTPLKP
jgi:hypothetical protein